MTTMDGSCADRIHPELEHMIYSWSLSPDSKGGWPTWGYNTPWADLNGIQLVLTTWHTWTDSMWGSITPWIEFHEIKKIGFVYIHTYIWAGPQSWPHTPYGMVSILHSRPPPHMVWSAMTTFRHNTHRHLEGGCPSFVHALFCRLNMSWNHYASTRTGCDRL